MSSEPSLLALLGVLLAAFVGGIINSIAGGGTLLTFPSLVALGVTGFTANATSTVALLPGSLASMWGYRGELRGARGWARRMMIPSLIGGGIGAWIFMRTPPEDFDTIVPFLVLAATLLFMAQDLILRPIRRRTVLEASSSEVLHRDPTGAPWLFFAVQFGVAMYGGYFGAGAGILMLAALGLMGFTNIHRMNGLKNWGGFSMNLVASVMFAARGLVNWPIALTMAVGGLTGGYTGSQLAQRIGQERVRRAVVIIGMASFLYLLWRAIVD